MSNQTVQVLVVGALDVQVTAADIVDSLIVDHERAVGMLKRGMCGQNRVVRLNDRCSDLRSRIDAELQLALLAVIDGEALHEESTKSRPSTTTERVEDEETLKTGAVVCHTADLVQDIVNQFLSDGVMASGVVVGGIFLSSDHVLRVEKGTVGTGADFVHYIGFEIGVDCARDEFAITCYGCQYSAY